MPTVTVLKVTPSNKESTVSEDNGELEICLTKDKETARGFNVAMVFTEESSTRNAATGEFVYCTHRDITVLKYWGRG